ncbi:hypothetical protein NDA11_000484 [Ustilago hordei]|nr:hypothetical protein NDA11_000484 [Ustilago hordei]
MLPFLAVCRSGFADAIAELEGNKPFLMMIASSKSGNAPLWVSCRICVRMEGYLEEANEVERKARIDTCSKQLKQQQEQNKVERGRQTKA